MAKIKEVEPEVLEEIKENTEPMKKYRKTAVIEIIEELEDGTRLVQNEGDSSDIWEIPKDTFERTYEEVTTVEEWDIITIQP